MSWSLFCIWSKCKPIHQAAGYRCHCYFRSKGNMQFLIYIFMLWYEQHFHRKPLLKVSRKYDHSFLSTWHKQNGFPQKLIAFNIYRNNLTFVLSKLKLGKWSASVITEGVNDCDIYSSLCVNGISRNPHFLEQFRHRLSGLRWVHNLLKNISRNPSGDGSLEALIVCW